MRQNSALFPFQSCRRNLRTCLQLGDGFVGDPGAEEVEEERESAEKAGEYEEETDLMAALKVLSLASTPSLAISSSRAKLAST